MLHIDDPQDLGIPDLQDKKMQNTKMFVILWIHIV